MPPENQSRLVLRSFSALPVSPRSTTGPQALAARATAFTSCPAAPIPTKPAAEGDPRLPINGKPVIGNRSFRRLPLTGWVNPLSAKLLFPLPYLQRESVSTFKRCSQSEQRIARLLELKKISSQSTASAPPPFGHPRFKSGSADMILKLAL